MAVGFQLASSSALIVNEDLIITAIHPAVQRTIGFTWAWRMRTCPHLFYLRRKFEMVKRMGDHRQAINR